MQRPALEDGYIEHPWVTHQSSEFQRNMGPLPAEEVKKDTVVAGLDLSLKRQVDF